MRSSFVSLALTAFASLSSAVFVPGHGAPEHQLEERGGDVCKSVKVIVTLLKKHHASPFCSSFLGLTTKTITSTTGTTTTTSITTEVVTVPTTSTTTWTTFSISTTVYRAIATSTTTLGTFTEITTETTTQTVAPTGTLTVTSWYTADPYQEKRVVVAPKKLEERDNAIPSYIKHYASSAISQACKCLSLPTITATVPAVATSTTVTTVVTSTTTTETVSAFVRDISASTVFITRWIPHYHTSTSTSTETATTTTPEYALTTTVSRAFPTECTNIIAGGKTYNTLVRSPYLYFLGGYDIDSPYPEERRSICCVDCFNRPNCMYWHVVATNFCRYYSRIEQAPGAPTTDQCPFGTGTESLTGQIFNNPETPWYGKGPCL